MANRSCWTQSVLLILYFCCIFINTRIFDAVLWLWYGTSSMQFVDPTILSVHQLKQLLDSRGISYSGYIEKKELVQLVKDTATIFEGEIKNLPIKEQQQNNKAIPNSSSYFKGSEQFFEEVEDSKDSIWLVQVIPANNENSSFIMSENNWKYVSNYLTQFSIRTGIYDCSLDQRLCISKGWTQPLLLLSFPKTVEAKDKIVVASYNTSNPKFIIQWIREQMMSYVQYVKSVQELENDWLTTSDSIFSCSSETVKVLLLTNLLNPPLFFAALSIKFTGRIKFGVFTAKRDYNKQLQKKLKINGNFNMPVYMIIARNQTFVYGQQKPQYANFKYMNSFLKVMQPEMNDVFIISLILINLLTCLRIFQIIQNISSLDTWFRDAVRIIWTAVSLNFWLLSVWVILVGIVQWQLVNYVCHFITKLLQMVVLTEVGSLMISDYLLLYDCPMLFCISFLSYLLIWRKFDRYLLSSSLGGLGDNNEMIGSTVETNVIDDQNNWWGDMLPFESFFLDSLFRSRQFSPLDEEVEDRIDDIVSRLRIPSFWLQPAIPKDYIKDLPVWMYNNNNNNDEDSSSSSQTDDEMDAIKRLMDDGRNCRDQRYAYPASSSLQHLMPYCRNISSGSGGIRNNLRSIEILTSEQQSSISQQTECKLIKEAGGGGNGNAKLKFCSECLKSKQMDNYVATNIIVSSDCSICLDNYETGCWLCGLPCGHTFHQDCIQIWLERDNHHCPICRWPAYKCIT